jgi:predicted nucleic acid-binding protein
MIFVDSNIPMYIVGVSARDALHLAVMNRYGIEQILSFDKGFDGAPGVTRLPTSL